MEGCGKFCDQTPGIWKWAVTVCQQNISVHKQGGFPRGGSPRGWSRYSYFIVAGSSLSTPGDALVAAFPRYHLHSNSYIKVFPSRPSWSRLFSPHTSQILSQLIRFQLSYALKDSSWLPSKVSVYDDQEELKGICISARPHMHLCLSILQGLSTLNSSISSVSAVSKHIRFFAFGK